MNDDLFDGDTAPGLPPGENENQTSFCLCNVTEKPYVCGRRATSDTTADSSEPQRNVLLGVPSVIAEKRRRKREVTVTDEDETTGNPRTYFTDYRYWVLMPN